MRSRTVKLTEHEYRQLRRLVTATRDYDKAREKLSAGTKSDLDYLAVIRSSTEVGEAVASFILCAPFIDLSDEAQS